MTQSVPDARHELTLPDLSHVPGGVVNLLTGRRGELIGQFSSHMDVNAIIYCGSNRDQIKTIQDNAAVNVKRVIHYEHDDWPHESAQGPYFILDTQEVKTTWHPLGSDLSLLGLSLRF